MSSRCATRRRAGADLPMSPTVDCVRIVWSRHHSLRRGLHDLNAAVTPSTPPPDRYAIRSRLAAGAGHAADPARRAARSSAAAAAGGALPQGAAERCRAQERPLAGETAAVLRSPATHAGDQVLSLLQAVAAQRLVALLGRGAGGREADRGCPFPHGRGAVRSAPAMPPKSRPEPVEGRRPLRYRTRLLSGSGVLGSVM
jgi:hypothetical protein